MKDNAKIVYEVKEDGTHIEMRGNSIDLFKGVCRLVANVKKNIELNEGVDFNKMLIEGVENSERELKLQEVIQKHESGEDVLSELLDMLKEALDD